MKNYQNIKKNEIDMFIVEVKKYYKLFFAITIGSFILSIIYATFIHKPIYQASALLQIGKKNNTLLEPTNALQIKLLDKFDDSSKKILKYPRISNVKVFKRGGGILRIDAIGVNKKVLKEYLDDIIKYVAIEHNKIVENYILENNTSLGIMQQNLFQSKENLKKLKRSTLEEEEILQQNIKLNKNISNNALVKLLRNDRLCEYEERRLTSYTKKIKQYNKILLPERTFKTHLLNEVKFSDSPINSGKSMIIVVGTISGILFSLLLISLLSFIRRENE